MITNGMVNVHAQTYVCMQGRRSEKIVGGLKGSEGATRIRVESRVLLGRGANPRKVCTGNRFLNCYKAEFGLKQHIIAVQSLHVHFHFSSA